MTDVIATFPGGYKRRVSGKDMDDVRQKIAEMNNMFLTTDNSSMDTFAEFGMRGFLNNILAFPKATGDLLALGAGAGEYLTEQTRDLFTGRDENQSLRQNFEQQQGMLPASALSQLPAPTTSDLRAGVQAGAQTLMEGNPAMLGDRFREFQIQEAMRLAGLRHQQPFAAQAGSVGGDVLSLLLAQRPFAPGRAARHAAARESAELQLKESAFLRDQLPEKVQSQLQDALSRHIGPFAGTVARETGRGLKKAGETGLEGALLAALQDGDPLSTLMWAAGGQAAGSFAMHLAFHPVRALLPAIGTAFVATQLFEAAKIGEQNLGDIIEGFEFAMDKTTYALGSGMIAALLGSGRVRNIHTEHLPALMDAITAVPRGSVLSLIEQMTNTSADEQQEVLGVLKQFQTDPRVFTENQRNALGRAINSEKKDALIKEIRRLKRDNKSFAQLLEGMNQ